MNFLIASIRIPCVSVNCYKRYKELSIFDGILNQKDTYGHKVYSIFNLLRNILLQVCSEEKTDNVNYRFATYIALIVYEKSVQGILKLVLESDFELYSKCLLESFFIIEPSNLSISTRGKVSDNLQAL